MKISDSFVLDVILTISLIVSIALANILMKFLELSYVNEVTFYFIFIFVCVKICFNLLSKIYRNCKK